MPLIRFLAAIVALLVVALNVLTANNSASASAAVPVPSGIVAWWPGDNSADDIAGRSDGIITGATFGRGMVKSAFKFDGVSYVDVGNRAAIRVSGGDFTVDAWVKFSRLTGAQAILDKMLVETQVPNSDGWRLFKTADHRMAFCLGGVDVDGCSESGSTSVFSSAVVAKSVWYHVAAVKSGTDLTLILNGVNQDSTVVSEMNDSDSAPLRFGATGDGDMQMKGSLDEVELFNQAVATEDIAGVYGAGSAGKIKVTCGGEFVTILGTDGPDYLKGTAGNDVIHGLAGDDAIDTIEGNDIACGGADDDLLIGGSGDDELFGDGAADFLEGGPGTNVLRGGPGDDSLTQGALLDGGKGSDALLTGGEFIGGPDTDYCADWTVSQVGCEVSENWPQVLGHPIIRQWGEDDYSEYWGDVRFANTGARWDFEYPNTPPFNFSGSVFGGEVWGTDFSDADFKRARIVSTLDGVELANGIFRGTNFDGAYISVRAVGVDFSGASFKAATFEPDYNGLDNAIFEDADFRGATLRDVRFAPGGYGGGPPRFDGADFSDADLTNSLFHENSMRFTRFLNANLTGASFAGSSLEYSDFTESDMTDAYLGGGLFNAHFDRAILLRTRFAGGFTGATFIGAALTGTRFESVDLTDADFSGAVFSGVSWVDTICPDGTNSDANGGTCIGHLEPAAP